MTEHNAAYGSKMVKALGAELAEFGGLLRCTSCGLERPLGDPGRRLRDGWPKHCGYTMRWWTQRQLDAGEDRG
jgi:hypothetical protein